MTDFDNRGGLWKNDKRETDKHPQLKGEAIIDGVPYWVSGWTSKEGGKKPVVSLAFSAKDSQRAPNPAKKPEPDFDDDLGSLPF